MIDQISFVKGQLWVVIGLLIWLVVCTALCNYRQYRKNKETRRKNEKILQEPRFNEMWDKDQLNELIAQASSHLKTYPNNQSALYFLAKAFMAQGRYEEARGHIERLLTIEPSMRAQWQRSLDEIDRGKSS